jgi:hypothetical protein
MEIKIHHSKSTYCAYFQDGDNVDYLWRYARALYKRSKVATNETDRKNLILEGYEVAERALQRGAKVSAVHKWFSILLDAKSHYDGMKARITVTEKVKQHMLVILYYIILILLSIKNSHILKYN